MNTNIILFTIFIPMIAGTIIFFSPLEKRIREILVMVFVILNSCIVYGLVFSMPEGIVFLLKLAPSIDIAFRIDGISRIFALLLASLWPIASLWSFEYMYHEERPNNFFGLYTATFGITLGICFAANLITMYLFYEVLTLITLPLIMHSRNEFSKPAGIKYIAYSVGGATASFIGIMLCYSQFGTFDFVAGGMGVRNVVNGPVLLWAFILMFFGFGVKAAVFPLHEWLPSVGVAPTPVTTLLHAVAVVKSGCFAIIRVTFYTFGARFLAGSWAQDVAVIFASFTIIFGSLWAYRETHFKRRLAMSTVSNLSYILLGAMVMTQKGLAAALLHMLFHGVMKICLFFVAGTCHVISHADYVTDLKGYGRKMPVTFGAFTIASLALIGVPPLCGFYSKFNLGSASLVLGRDTWTGYFGLAALLISAVLTAGYLLPICVRSYFPEKNFKYDSIKEIKDPSWKMKLPFVVLSILCLLLGLFSNQVYEFIFDSIGGLF